MGKRKDLGFNKQNEIFYLKNMKSIAAKTSDIAQSLIRKKKILVLISDGGGGHKAAGESLKDILGREYNVSIVNVFSEILQPLDTLHWLTRGHFSGETLYNFCLRRHHSRLIHLIAQYGPRRMTPKSIFKAFNRFLSDSSQIPDLVISTTPFVNSGIASATQKWDIPLIILPTDLDGSTFLYKFPSKMLFSNVKIALAYDDQDIRKTTFEKTSVGEDRVVITGFPVRPKCMRKYTPSDIAHFNRKHNLFENFQTVTLIMGAVGGNLIFEHAKTLAEFDPRPHNLSLQINICVGQNNAIAAKIRSYLIEQGATPLSHSTLMTPYGLVIHLRGFTKDIIEIMAASDIIITKTGSCTVNEALYLRKPVLLDNTPKSTARHLWWENFNIPFVEKHGLGHAFKDPRQLHMLIPSILKYPIGKEGRKLEFPNFERNIFKLVRELLED